MTRLIPCPRCALLIAAHESMCPHCNRALGGVMPRVVPVLLGLTLAGCPDGKDDTSTVSDSFDSQAAYGVPDTDFTASDSATDGSGSGGSGSESSGSSGSSGSSDGSESTEGSSSDSSGSTGADGSTTG